jgi:hypothetical protein
MTDQPHDIHSPGGKVQGYGLLFEYAVKWLFFAALFELILYRLVSRLGMHLTKLAQKYESVKVTFRVLSSLGFGLLNVVSILVFMVLTILLLHQFRIVQQGVLDRLAWAGISLVLLMTVAFILIPPAMVGTIFYNFLSLIVLILLTAIYLTAHRQVSHRVFIVTFLVGISGWLYFQIMSTAYGFFGFLDAPPLVHESNRVGEGLMVLASIFTLWAYGGISFATKNKRQQRRLLVFASVGTMIFLFLFFADYFASLYDPAVAESIRKGGEGVGWIFQMGMGYTFYLPFALYMLGLLCWSYTVIKLVSVGRLAGYGLGIMFMAGYALQLSHLTLLVVLGMVLLWLDGPRGIPAFGGRAVQRAMVKPPTSVLEGQTT